MQTKRPKEWMDERRDPGEREPEACAPGSIEQQLDMCESGTLRGDEILHSHGNVDREEGETHSEEPLDEIMNRFDITSSETDREGSEMSGDEHSSGNQGTDIPMEPLSIPEIADNSDVVRRENDDNVIIFRQKTPKSTN